MSIKKVIVVHKTHLDIGFTDSAENVLHKYLETFIPGAVRTARECNKDGKRNFVWTVGSYLIERYLKEGSDPEMLAEAIKNGFIAWHGLPLTTHTELMDGKLFEYGLSISKRLDERFGRRTIAAKMTDVPSHTHAMVPYLAKAGIKYLHIGINGSSKLVKLPPLCRLRYGDDEIILDYAALYGASSVCGEYALEFAHTPDNSGPPSPESVAAEMERLREKYPGAEIASGTMDQFAEVVLERIDELPVVTEELGDTWIHGVATDPYKTAAYYELLRLRDQWEREEPKAVASPAWRDFCGGLLMVCEHSWGRDVKRWLSDWKNWEKQDFYKARERDHITAEDVMPAGELLREFTLHNEPTFVQGLCSYKLMEESWLEQRGYIREAVTALPEKWRRRAIERLETLRPAGPGVCAEPTSERSFEISGYKVCLMYYDDFFNAHCGYSPLWVISGYHDYSRWLWACQDKRKSGLAYLYTQVYNIFAIYKIERTGIMNEALRQWLDAEMKDYAPRFKAFNRRLMKRVPLWMALSVAAMVALGFGVGIA